MTDDKTREEFSQWASSPELSQSILRVANDAGTESTAATGNQIVELMEKSWQAAKELYAPREAELETKIGRLRGQLQHCVNHLERLSLKSYDESAFPCIESANKALYETLIATKAMDIGESE